MNTETVYRLADPVGHNTMHYHADRECASIRGSAVAEMTPEEAVDGGHVACGECVGRWCPRCERRIPGRIKYHLRRCDG